MDDNVRREWLMKQKPRVIEAIKLLEDIKKALETMEDKATQHEAFECFGDYKKEIEQCQKCPIASDCEEHAKA